MDSAYVFFYGTLMRGFELRRAIAPDNALRAVGQGHIRGQLFDLGSYPAAVSSPHGLVRGETYEMIRREILAVLDDVEGYRRSDPLRSLYVRRVSAVTLDTGRQLPAWVYFYNGSLAGARPIPSGDYRHYLAIGIC